MTDFNEESKTIPDENPQENTVVAKNNPSLFFKKQGFKNKKNSSFNKNHGGSVKVIPLGGLGEIGRNMTVFEYQNEIIIIDCGLMFPDNELPGVDLVLADFSYIKKNIKKVKALLITHGHEDHIGGVPYFLKECPGIPIFAPMMALELIKLKLIDQKVNFNPKKLLPIERHKKMAISPAFEALFMEVNHSIRDSFGIALYTPVGTIVHTGDFKIESDSLGSSEFDLHSFAKVGSEGVLLLCSDSTNVEKKFEDKTESDVSKNLELISERASGRVLVATFASNVNRIIKLVEIAAKQDKKVAIIGRSMENNFAISKKLAYTTSQKNTMIKPQTIKNYPDNKVVVIMTGTQGENLSALTRMSQGAHKILKIKAQDTIIISASVIPGNEKPISRVLNALYEKGAQVFYSRNSGVHVSGHGAQDNLLMMLRLVKPKFFLPVHGENRHLILHAKLAQTIGMHPSHTLVAKNGDVVQLSSQQAQIVHHLHMQNVYVENNSMIHTKTLIEERRQLSLQGLVCVILNLSALQSNFEDICDVFSVGFIAPSDEKSFEAHMKGLISLIFSKSDNLQLSESALCDMLSQSIEKEYHKKPLVKTKILKHL